MGQFTFRVRKLPDPTPFIAVTDAQGNPSRFKGGGIAKGSLMGIDGIGAAIDDGILDIGTGLKVHVCDPQRQNIFRHTSSYGKVEL
jgi:hypothetical protein